MSDKAAYALLSADATVSGLVGTRIYPVQAPKNATVPYIVYVLDAAQNEIFTTKGTTGLVSDSLEVYCVATEYGSARTLSDAVASVLNGYAGTAGTQVIRGAFRRGGSSTVEFVPPGADKPYYVISLDFEVWRQEATT